MNPTLTASQQAWEDLGHQMLSLTQSEVPSLSEDQARSRVLAALLLLLGDLTPTEASAIRLQEQLQTRHGLEVTA